MALSTLATVASLVEYPDWQWLGAGEPTEKLEPGPMTIVMTMQTVPKLALGLLLSLATKRYVVAPATHKHSDGKEATKCEERPSSKKGVAM